VTIACCTLDPGSAAASGAAASSARGPFQTSADGRELARPRLTIEAAITTMTIDAASSAPSAPERSKPPKRVAAARSPAVSARRGFVENAPHQAIASFRPSARRAGRRHPAGEVAIRFGPAALSARTGPCDGFLRARDPKIAALLSPVASPPSKYAAAFVEQFGAAAGRDKPSDLDLSL